MRYAIVIEKTDTNYAAYVPDLSGCIVTGASIEETEKLIHEAIKFHLDGLREDVRCPIEIMVFRINQRAWAFQATKNPAIEPGFSCLDKAAFIRLACDAQF